MSNIVKPIIFVTGKGGVGKSLFAAGLALNLSAKGRRVLLVELGSNSFYQNFLNIPVVEFDPRPVEKNLDIAIWNTDSCLRQYVTFYVKVEKLYDIFFENKIMREIINASPALKELAILGKITSGIREIGPPLDYDHIVIDSYSTGHHKALLMAPKGISKVFHHGPMGHHSQKMVEVIKNAEICEQVVLFKAEDLPTTEALELVQFLKDEFGSNPQLVCNQFLEIPNEISKSDRADLRFYQKYMEQQQINLGRINGEFLKIPYILEEKTGMELARALSEEHINELTRQ